MLTTPKTSDPKDRLSDDDPPPEKKDVKDDPSAEFIQEMAESGSASDLGTINAAADAVEGKEEQAVHRHPDKKRDENDGGKQDTAAKDE